MALCQKPAPQFHAASNPQVDDCRVENNLLEAVITLNGVPLPVASCTDGVQNGDETSVDAGGSCAAAAPIGSTCSDGLQNGDEMGIDYGGSCSLTVPVPGGYPGDDTDAGPGGLDGGDCRNGVVDFEGLVDNAPLPDDYGSPYIKFSLVETGTFVPYPNGHRPVAEVPPPLSRCGPPCGVGGGLLREHEAFGCFFFYLNRENPGQLPATDPFTPSHLRGFSRLGMAGAVFPPPPRDAHGCTNYRAPLTRKRHIPQHTNRWAPRTRKRHQQEHRPQRPTERSDPTQRAKGRTGDCPGPRKETAPRRNVTQGDTQR